MLKELLAVVAQHRHDHAVCQAAGLESLDQTPDFRVHATDGAVVPSLAIVHERADVDAGRADLGSRWHDLTPE